MYDPKSEAHEFVAADRAEAVAEACRFFDASEEDLVIQELPEGSVSGLTARTLVVAIPRNAPRPSRDARDDGPRGRDRDDRERGRGRGRDRDRDRDRGGRGRRGGRERGEGRGRSEELRAEPLPAESEEDVGPSEATRVGELSSIGEFVAGLLERMALGSFEVEEGEEDGLCVVHLRGDAAGRLTGGDGRAVDAIQLLANQAAMRHDDEDPPRVVIDVEGDRESRESYLEDVARRAARRALKIGRAVALDPMNSAERRILHVALRDTPDVATMSTGTGRYRQVVVVPKGAPEYDEARRTSQEAASNDS